MASDFLKDVLVVELGERTSAGACGSLLAQLGAEVVLVEPAAPQTSHKWTNRPVIAAGKRSVVHRPGEGGRDPLVADLVARADILLISSDISEDDRAIFAGDLPAGQIRCDFTAFGHEGPLAGLAVPDELVQAYCGVADTTGPRDGAPSVTGAPFVSMETAVYGAAAILAALHSRCRTGCGQRIDMALYDVGVNALLTFVPLCLIGRPAKRNGNRHPTLSPWNSYRANDGKWVLICAPTDDQWRRLCDVMECPDLAHDPRFATTTARMDNVEDIDREIAGWTMRYAAAEVVGRVNDALIPSSPIETLDTLHSEPNILRRGMSLEVTDPVLSRKVYVPGNPFRIAGQPDAFAPRIPLPDSDRDYLRSRSIRDAFRTTPIASRQSDGALAGLRVVEIGMNTVAPLAGRQFGALGADVIKIEPPTGDTNRNNAPLRDDGASYVFMLSNTDKRGVVLDLREAEDRETLFDLLSTADAVIENLKPGSLERLGLGATEVLARLPHLIYCSVNGFGFTTAYPARPALDTVIQAMSGAMDASTIECMPTKSGISISDQLGGQFGLLAILAGILKRNRDGSGMHLDLAMQDSSAWATSMRWNRSAHPYDRFRTVATADGYIVLDAPQEINTNLEKLSRSDAVAALQARGTAAAPVLSVAEVLNHPQTKARNLFLSADTPDGSSFWVLGCPMKLLGDPPLVRKTMPALGYVDSDLEAEFGAATRAARRSRNMPHADKRSA